MSVSPVTRNTSWTASNFATWTAIRRAPRLGPALPAERLVRRQRRPAACTCPRCRGSGLSRGRTGLGPVVLEGPSSPNRVLERNVEVLRLEGHLGVREEPFGVCRGHATRFGGVDVGAGDAPRELGLRVVRRGVPCHAV